MCATPTHTATPNATQTRAAAQATQTAAVAATQTAVAGYTATPTPDSCLQLNEVCPNPILDHDGNAAIDELDRALEIYNCSPTANLWLTDYVLATDTGQSVTLPASKVVISSTKVLYGSDLQFTLPSTGTLTLTAPWGALIDTLPYTTTQAAGECCARSPDGGTLGCGVAPTLGKPNP